MNQTFDLTPDPRVLLALTHTPLAPLDALCELIDNSIDAFTEAEKSGSRVEHPLIIVEIPGVGELNRRAGILRVRDNGNGLSPDHAERAIRAGYSGKKAFGSLGLFGMGFNISTGKLGRKTVFTTVRAGMTSLAVSIDLPKMIESGSYDVPVAYDTPSPDFLNGTRIEISDWWPEGDANHGFIRKLSGYPKDTVRQSIGRRYATILRKNQIRIVVNGEPCKAFEHCVWDKSRFVERKGHGRIPAQFAFDDVLSIQTRCVNCDQLIPENTVSCPQCESLSFRTVEERVRGWVGIQRYDDKEQYGIDLIRNGRAIRVSEQSAFFDFTDEFQKSVHDYPIDSLLGRIVGEVHLDHVHVDFLKQDFARTEGEWRRAIAYLRGESSLQPLQPGASENRSPIFKLYQGYRKVRNFGKRDMYMGVWDAERREPTRISREVEKELLEKFDHRLPGYFDDSEWWKYVEQADTAPADEIIQCPNSDCRSDNLRGAETCAICDAVIVGKECRGCNALIPTSATSCEKCGTSQVIVIHTPWKCHVCSQANDSLNEHCQKCGKPSGTENSSSRDYLLVNSDGVDSLSLKSFKAILADGNESNAVDVLTYKTRNQIEPVWERPKVSSVSFRSAAKVEIFVDASHKLFRDLKQSIEYVVSAEVASFLVDTNARLISTYPALHTVAALASTILETEFGSRLEDNPSDVQEAAKHFFEDIKVLMSNLRASETSEIYSDLSDRSKQVIFNNMMNQRQDPASMARLLESSAFLKFIDDSTVVDIFEKRPDLFFDGNVFRKQYKHITLPASFLAEAQLNLKRTFHNCLEDLSQFGQLQDPSRLLTTRAKAALEVLLLDFQ